jgi:hypothetical protein
MVAIGWFRDNVTALPKYVLQQVTTIYDPFSNAGNRLTDITLETQKACDEVSSPFASFDSVILCFVSVFPLYFVCAYLL